MKEEITLKEFIQKAFEASPMNAMHAGTKLIELAGIENWLNMMYGIELVIKVRLVEKKEGRFYGKSLLDSLNSPSA